MIVYCMEPNPDYPGIKYSDFDAYFDTYRWLKWSTRSVRRKWIPPKCHYHTMVDFHDSSCRTKRQSQALFDRGPCDFVAGIPAFSKRARKALSPRLSKFGEFLPLDVEGDTTSYSYYHCTHLLELLDLPQSQPNVLNDGTITEVERLIFDESKMKDVYLFRIAEIPKWSIVFVTDEFVKEFPPDLIGFVFKEVWRDSSELPLPKKKKASRKGG